nr:MAG: capsid protein [Avian astrovirus 15]
MMSPHFGENYCPCASWSKIRPMTSKGIWKNRFSELGSLHKLRALNFRKFQIIFIPDCGVEDRKIMSDPKPQRVRRPRRKRQPPKKEEKEVDITLKVKDEQKKKPRRARRTVQHVFETTGGQRNMSTTDATQRALRRLQRRVKRIDGRSAGPKVQSAMRTSLTLGPVFGNVTNSLAKQQRVWLNPVLLKPADASNDTTPLTTRGSMYNLYRITSVRVKVKPLVGNSNVNGTLVIADLDNDPNSAKPDTIDSVKARPHREAPVGSFIDWHIPGRQLVGPRGGWWVTDTNESPGASLGPAINISTYLQTFNLMGTKSGPGASMETTTYNGPIGLAELEVSYLFSNLDPKPALAHLIRKEGEMETQDAKLVTLSDGTVAMEVNQTSLFARSIDQVEDRSRKRMRDAPTATKDKGNSIWAVGSEVVGAVASVLGPWGWLLKGGWWCVRKIFGVTELRLADGKRLAATKSYYSIYPSVDDAQRDIPIRGAVTGQGASSAFPSGYYYWQQLNADNLNIDYVMPGAGYTDGPEDPDNPINDVCTFLPSSQAGEPTNKLPTLYNYTVDGGWKAGLPGLIIDPGEQPAVPVDAVWYITGRGHWYYYVTGQNELPSSYLTITTQELLTLDSAKHQWLYGRDVGYDSTRDQYLSLFLLDERAVVLGGSDLGYQGMVHNRESFIKSLKRAKENDKEGTQECPSSIVQWVNSWQGSTNWTTWLHDKGVFGTVTAAIPVKIGTGAVAYPFKQNPYGSGDNYVHNCKADGFLLANLDTEQLSVLFFVDWDPPTQYKGAFPLFFASNVNNFSRWKERMTNWISHNDTPPRMSRHLARHDDSDIETATEDEELPPPLPVKVRRK